MQACCDDLLLSFFSLGKPFQTRISSIFPFLVDSLVVIDDFLMAFRNALNAGEAVIHEVLIKRGALFSIVPHVPVVGAHPIVA